MWVNKILFETILADNKKMSLDMAQLGVDAQNAIATSTTLRIQKAKDDITIDWMRHRINALEKERAILVQKAAGVSLPVPEIVPARPGSMTVPSFDSMPNFEDVGDTEAVRLGARHDDMGILSFTDTEPSRPAATS